MLDDVIDLRLIKRFLLDQLMFLGRTKRILFSEKNRVHVGFWHLGSILNQNGAEVPEKTMVDFVEKRTARIANIALCQAAVVDVGALVTRGQQIARSGDVGFCPTAHLHVARVPSKGHEGSDMYWCRCLTEIWANYSCERGSFFKNYIHAIKWTLELLSDFRNIIIYFSLWKFLDRNKSSRMALLDLAFGDVQYETCGIYVLHWRRPKMNRFHPYLPMSTSKPKSKDI